MNESRPRRSLITFAFQAIKLVDPGQDVSAEHRRVALMMAYLWPLTCCGVILPLIAYLQYRQDDVLGTHVRQGAVLALGYAGVMVLLGAVNGIAGRIASDWLSVSLPVLIVAMLVVLVLAGFGWRCYQRALVGAPVDIPWISDLADRT